MMSILSLGAGSLCGEPFRELVNGKEKNWREKRADCWVIALKTTSNADLFCFSSPPHCILSQKMARVCKQGKLYWNSLLRAIRLLSFNRLCKHNQMVMENNRSQWTKTHVRCSWFSLYCSITPAQLLLPKYSIFTASRQGCHPPYFVLMLS